MDSANLKIVGDMTAGRESSREQHQEPIKITAFDVGTDAFHQDQGFRSCAVSQPMLQLWPRIVIQIDWQVLNVIEAPPPLRHLLFGVDSFCLIAFQDLDAPAAQEMLKAVGPGIAAATNIYNLLHTIRNGLLD